MYLGDNKAMEIENREGKIGIFYLERTHHLNWAHHAYGSPVSHVEINLGTALSVVVWRR